MPVKRSRKFKNQIQKESQVIRTRLIEISLKLDDFIYQKKPITESEAEMFLREVVSYKTKCSKDERSLQVIEKIVRCMKSIIAELQETRIDHCNTYEEDSYLDIGAGAASPVYSLQDEDRTQLTQEVPEEQTSTNIGATSNQQRYLSTIFLWLLTLQTPCIITTGNIDCNYDYDRTQFTQIEQRQNIADNKKTLEVITISDDDTNDYFIQGTENANMITKPTLHSDAGIHEALSNLSLKDISQKDIADTDAEFSQSILHNFHDIDTLEQVKKIDVHSYDKRIINKNTNVTKTMHAKINLHCQNFTKHNEKPPFFDSRKVNNVATASNSKGSATNNGKKKTMYDKPLKTLTCLGNVTNLAKADKVVSARNIPNEQKAIPVTTKTINEVQLNFTPVMYNANINQNKTIADQIKSNKENAPIIKKNRAPRKKKEMEANNSKKAKTGKDLNIKSNDNMNNIKPAPKRRNTKKTNRAINDCPIPIYNKNVENDLSWMENIRFVREIQDDEYDRKLAGLDENFWDSYHLPPNFDEGDFL